MVGTLVVDGIIAGIVSGAVSTFVTAAIVIRAFARWYLRPWRDSSNATLERVEKSVTPNGGHDSSLATEVVRLRRTCEQIDRHVSQLLGRR